MANDIFTAVKGLTSPREAVAPQRPASSAVEQASRQRVERLQRQDLNAQSALAFFTGKRLLGGNLLLGGGSPVDTRVTRGLFAEIQRDEDEAFALLLQQTQDRVDKGQFRASAFNSVSSEERVRRLVENAPQSQDPQRYRYSSYDPAEDKRRLEEQQASIDAILESARSRLTRPLQEGELPDATQRPRIEDILPERLIETTLDNTIDFNLNRRLAQTDITASQKLVPLDDLLRIRRPNSFIGLTTPAQIEERRLELGLTETQVKEEQQRDTENIPTHVQVVLHGRSLDLSPGFIEAQRRIDPNFDIESHRAPAGELVLQGGTVLPSRTVTGRPLRHTLTYEEYQGLQYRPPVTGSDAQIDYFSATAFRHPDGNTAVLDDKAVRSAVQTVALTTPETPAAVSSVTRGGVVYDVFDLSLPSERDGGFKQADIVFEDATFGNSVATNILQALQIGDLEIEATQQGYNRNYGNNRDLTLDSVYLRKKLNDAIPDNENDVRFQFFARELATDGVDLRVYVRQRGGTPALAFEGVRARFF